jgi:hypothetical protein
MLYSVIYNVGIIFQLSEAGAAHPGGHQPISDDYSHNARFRDR